MSNPEADCKTRGKIVFLFFLFYVTICDLTLSNFRSRMYWFWTLHFIISKEHFTHYDKLLIKNFIQTFTWLLSTSVLKSIYFYWSPDRRVKKAQEDSFQFNSIPAQIDKTQTKSHAKVSQYAVNMTSWTFLLAIFSITGSFSYIMKHFEINNF